MNKKLVAIFENNKKILEDKFKQAHPENYKALVKMLFELFQKELEEAPYSTLSDNTFQPNAEKIHEIDDGSYQGTLLYLIPSTAYQPDEYYYVAISYGSCSGCDTLERIRHYSSDAPTEEQIKQYMTLLLHIVQRTKMLNLNSVGEYENE